MIRQQDLGSSSFAQLRQLKTLLDSGALTLGGNAKERVNNKVSF